MPCILYYYYKYHKYISEDMYFIRDKDARVNSHPKKTSLTKENLKNYRPVSNRSFISKVQMELFNEIDRLYWCASELGFQEFRRK